MMLPNTFGVCIYLFESVLENMVTFLKEVRAELVKVTWPTRSEVTRLTFVVIGISVIVGIYLGIADFGFVKLLELIVK